MTQLSHELLDIELRTSHASRYGKAMYNTEYQIGLCEALEPYIPIDAFMELFTACGEMVRAHQLTHFVFDKRSLRAFHQPSMEWYFIEWKQQLLSAGLAKHYKILPDEPWFHKCVEAGKAQILKDYPQNRLSELNITYVQSVGEAIAHAQKDLTHA